ncbi:MAG: riboflavin biosynthesis protein RibF [Saprospiraceae bacterium]
MQVIEGINALPVFHNPVITIGSFDGYHKGHKAIVDRTCEIAKEVNGQSVVVTFDPHPRSIIYPSDQGLKLLSTKEEKIELIGLSAVDFLVIVPFTVEFSQLIADEYIEKFIVQYFRPHTIVLGHDHRFGLNRLGDINFLQCYGEKFGYQVDQVSEQLVDNTIVSSTKVRNALMDTQVELALEYSGHPYLLQGKVVPGDQIGKSLGFPTANLQIDNPLKLVPPAGIYAVYAHIEKAIYPAMLYIGDRPAIKGNHNTSIEINILNFEADLYDTDLKVELVSFIRPDMDFDNMNLLKQQMQNDRVVITDLLQHRPSQYVANAEA